MIKDRLLISTLLRRLGACDSARHYRKYGRDYARAYREAGIRDARWLCETLALDPIDCACPGDPPEPGCPILNWRYSDPRETIKWPAIKAALKRKGFPL